jgi:hypothetical protein
MCARRIIFAPGYHTQLDLIPLIFWRKNHCEKQNGGNRFDFYICVDNYSCGYIERLGHDPVGTFTWGYFSFLKEKLTM